MNLKAIHLFLILLLSLFFTCCLGTIYEGFSGDKMDMKYTNSQNSNNSAGMQYNTPTGVDSYDKSQLDSNRIRHERRRRHPGQGLRRIDIPAGDEDLYILKSEIVPPVCPKCQRFARVHERRLLLHARHVLVVRSQRLIVKRCQIIIQIMIAICRNRC